MSDLSPISSLLMKTGERYEGLLCGMRREIIALSRLDLYDMVYFTFKTDFDVVEWEQNFIDTVIKEAKPIEDEAKVNFDLFGGINYVSRGYCPLCGSGAVSEVSGEGWSLPEGLKRHLEGHGQTKQCVIAREACAYVQWSMER